MKSVEIYTDGACRGNPGPGGWGAILRYGEGERELFGGEAQTTNNRMEMSAALEALRALKQPCIVDLYTDSQYLRQGVTQWLPNWVRRNWKTSAGDAVKNRDLWEALLGEVGRHQITWHWVKGHSGHPLNERADRLANRGIP